jgi:uncharacterized membrane protein
MSPEHQQPDSENTNAEIAFVQQALAAADRSERSSRIIVGLLAILAIVAFIWMHLQMFPLETLGGLLHSLLRVDLFFLVLLFALTMYLRQVMNKNTRTILRALANTRLLSMFPAHTRRRIAWMDSPRLLNRQCVF